MNTGCAKLTSHNDNVWAAPTILSIKKLMVFFVVVLLLLKTHKNRVQKNQFIHSTEEEPHTLTHYTVTVAFTVCFLCAQPRPTEYRTKMAAAKKRVEYAQ